MGKRRQLAVAFSSVALMHPVVHASSAISSSGATDNDQIIKAGKPTTMYPFLLILGVFLYTYRFAIYIIIYINVCIFICMAFSQRYDRTEMSKRGSPVFFSRSVGPWGQLWPGP